MSEWTQIPATEGRQDLNVELVHVWVRYYPPADSDQHLAVAYVSMGGNLIARREFRDATQESVKLQAEQWVAGYSSRVVKALQKLGKS